MAKNNDSDGSLAAVISMMLTVGLGMIFLVAFFSAGRESFAAIHSIQLAGENKPYSEFSQGFYLWVAMQAVKAGLLYAKAAAAALGIIAAQLLRLSWE